MLSTDFSPIAEEHSKKLKQGKQWASEPPTAAASGTQMYIFSTE